MNYHADGRTQTFLCHLTDILTVDTDALRLSVMETTHEKNYTAEPSGGQAHSLPNPDVGALGYR